MSLKNEVSMKKHFHRGSLPTPKETIIKTKESKWCLVDRQRQEQKSVWVGWTSWRQGLAAAGGARDRQELIHALRFLSIRQDYCLFATTGWIKFRLDQINVWAFHTSDRRESLGRNWCICPRSIIALNRKLNKVDWKLEAVRENKTDGITSECIE